MGRNCKGPVEQRQKKPETLKYPRERRGISGGALGRPMKIVGAKKRMNLQEVFNIIKRNRQSCTSMKFPNAWVQLYFFWFLIVLIATTTSHVILRTFLCHLGLKYSFTRNAIKWKLTSMFFIIWKLIGGYFFSKYSASTLPRICFSNFSTSTARFSAWRSNLARTYSFRKLYCWHSENSALRCFSKLWITACWMCHVWRRRAWWSLDVC